MAPGYSKLGDSNNDKVVKEADKALLPLLPDSSEDELTSDNSVIFSLRSTPTAADSPKYKVTVRVLKGGEKIRTALGWYQDVGKVLKGLNISEYQGGVNLVTTMITGTPSSIFTRQLQALRKARFDKRVKEENDDVAKQAIKDAGIEDPLNIDFADIDVAARHVLTTMLPRKVLARVKRNLRRNCRKPSNMKVREYVQHLFRINDEEIPLLPAPIQYAYCIVSGTCEVITLGCLTINVIVTFKE